MINPTKDDKKDWRRVVRGGEWDDGVRRTRVSLRFYGSPTYRGNRLGFRLVRNKQ